MRIGLVGAGRIGRIHAEALSVLDSVELTVADADAPRAQELAAAVGAAFEADPEALFDRVDGVVIASSSDSHAPLLLRAAKAGLPAFCEKPLALDLATSRAALDTVTEAGIPVQMGLQRRFDPGYRRVRDTVAGGALGQLYLLRHTSHDHEPPPSDYVATSGGIFADNLIHDFDVARFVSGQEVEEVYATGSVLVDGYFGEHGDVDTAAVVLRLSGGALAVLSAVRRDPVGYDVRLEAFGSADSVAAGWSERTPVVSADAAPDAPPSPHRRPADPFRTWTERFADAYRLELDAFVELVATGRTDVAATVADAHEALRIAVACQQSRTEHQPVSLSDVPEAVRGALTT